jgi:tRNA uridine 5-carboxymethylaminomethyl modification enzyme
LLRQDNADERLSRKSYELGLAGMNRIELLNEKLQFRDKIIEFLKNYSIKPQYINSLLESKGSSLLRQPVKLIDIILRPEISIFDVTEIITPLNDVIIQIPDSRRNEILESAEIVVKYEGYINREKLLAEKLVRLENIAIDNRFDYHNILSLSTEARQKLSNINPKTIGQASRIPGVSPSDINVLLVMLGR